MKKDTFLLITLLSVILASFGCSKNEKMPTPVVPIINPTTETPDSITFLALGDSYTIGQNVQVSERFPAQTAALLKSGGITISNPQYIAATGWTTDNLMNAINSQTLTNDYDVVTLLIGVNDQYQRRDTAGYAGKYEALLIKAILLAGGKRDHVFVLSIPDYSATPFVDASQKAFVSNQIDEFNAINKRVTLSYTVAYVDITPSTRQAATDASLIASDGLHPSGKEYQKWANMLAPLIKAVLWFSLITCRNKQKI